MSAQYRGIDKSSKKDLKLEGWIPAFENDQAIFCVSFLRKQMAENIGFKEHIAGKLIEYILIAKKLSPQYFTNPFKSDSDWISTNVTFLDYFWLICASLCVVCGDGTDALPSISGDIELDAELEKSEHSDMTIEYRPGNATIKVLDHEHGDKPKIILTADLIQCKTVITFKDTASAPRCRFCQMKLSEKNRVDWMALSEREREKEAAAAKKEE